MRWLFFLLRLLLLGRPFRFCPCLCLFKFLLLRPPLFVQLLSLLFGSLRPFHLIVSALLKLIDGFLKNDPAVLRRLIGLRFPTREGKGIRPHKKVHDRHDHDAADGQRQNAHRSLSLTLLNWTPTLAQKFLTFSSEIPRAI